jgi:hypothetical protein
MANSKQNVQVVAPVEIDPTIAAAEALDRQIVAILSDWAKNEALDVKVLLLDTVGDSPFPKPRVESILAKLGDILKPHQKRLIRQCLGLGKAKFTAATTAATAIKEGMGKATTSNASNIAGKLMAKMLDNNVELSAARVAVEAELDTKLRNLHEQGVAVLERIQTMLNDEANADALAAIAFADEKKAAAFAKAIALIKATEF